MKKNMSFQLKNININHWTFRGTLLMILLSVSNFLAIGQQATHLETDKGMTNAIAPYSADVRQAVLLASQYPQTLTILQNQQNQSMNSFQDIIGGFRQAKQEWFYTLTRYPNLIHNLAILPNGQDKDVVYKLLPNQDEELQKAAWKVYYNEKKDLVEIDNIESMVLQNFEKSIQSLDTPTRDAFRKLSNSPDVLSLLTNNIDLTAKLEARYKDNPSEVNSELSTLHDSLTLQSQTEMANLKKQLADNPQAKQEFDQAVRDYGNANGYNIPNQNYYNNNYGYNQNYYSNPYSYWLGYPSWYSSPLWYPGAFGYNSGFYAGFGGFGMYGYPYYGFSNWLYSGYYNRYPTLYRQYGNYYNHNNFAGNRGMGYGNRGMNYGNGGVNYGNRGMNYGNRGMSNGYSNPSLGRSNGQSYQNNGGNRSYGNSLGSFGRGNRFGNGSFGGGGGSHGGGGHGGGGRH